MDPVIVAALVDAGVSLANNITNQSRTKKNNAANEALMREAWQREDTAVQRRVADLKAAGLSPLLAAGDAAQSSQPISISAAKSDFKVDALQALSLAQNIKESDSKIALNEAEKARVDAITKAQEMENLTFDEKWHLTRDRMQLENFKFAMEGRLAYQENQWFASKTMAQISNLTSSTSLNRINVDYKKAELDWFDALNYAKLSNTEADTAYKNAARQNLVEERKKTAQEIKNLVLQGKKVSAETDKILAEVIYQELLYKEKEYNLDYSMTMNLRTNDSQNGGIIGTVTGIKTGQLLSGLFGL